MIIKTLVVGDIMTNCYLIGDPKELLVIDPGDEGERIYKTIQDNDYQVKYIVLTHCHHDHIGGVEYLKEKTGAEIVVGKEEAENYSNPAYNLSAHFGKNTPPPPPDLLVEEGDLIVSGDHSFQVIHTPGHTSGGICLLCRDVLISGDTLFRNSMGRADLPSGNLSILVQSIKNKLFTLEDSVEVYPGHGPSTHIGYEKKYNEVYQWENYADEW